MLFYAQQDVPLNLPDNHIVHNDIWLLHVQSFYAEQDYPSKLPDNHIVRKGIRLLHAVFF